DHRAGDLRRRRRLADEPGGPARDPDRVDSLQTRRRLRRRGSLRGDVEGVERLAPAHEEAVALRTAEADVGADLREPDAADELALRRPHGHAAISEPAPAGVAVAGDPHVALDVTARAVRATLDAVDHEIAEHLLV